MDARLKDSLRHVMAMVGSGMVASGTQRDTMTGALIPKCCQFVTAVVAFCSARSLPHPSAAVSSSPDDFSFCIPPQTRELWAPCKSLRSGQRESISRPHPAPLCGVLQVPGPVGTCRVVR